MLKEFKRLINTDFVSVKELNKVIEKMELQGHIEFLNKEINQLSGEIGTNMKLGIPYREESIELTKLRIRIDMLRRK